MATTALAIALALNGAADVLVSVAGHLQSELFYDRVLTFHISSTLFRRSNCGDQTDCPFYLYARTVSLLILSLGVLRLSASASVFASKSGARGKSARSQRWSAALFAGLFSYLLEMFWFANEVKQGSFGFSWGDVSLSAFARSNPSLLDMDVQTVLSCFGFSAAMATWIVFYLL